MAASLSTSSLDLSADSMCLEVLCGICFVLGFVVCRRARAKPFLVHKEPRTAEEEQKLLCKTIEAEAYSNNAEAALAMWRATKAHFCTPQETLCLIVQALMDADPKVLVAEVIDHMHVHKTDLQNSAIAAAVLEVVAQQGEVQIMKELWHTMQRRFDLCSTVQVQEVLISGYASVGDAKQVRECMAQVRSQGHKVTIRAYSLAIKGLLQHDQLDAALLHMQEMRQQGLVVPPFAVTQLVRAMVARSSADLHGALDKLQQCSVVPNADALTLLCEHCCRQHDITLAYRVEDFAWDLKVPFTPRIYIALLSVYASVGDGRALSLFKKMQASSTCIGEGLCVRLLETCADSQYAEFADEVFCYAKRSFQGTRVLYQSCLKVYTQSGSYDRACDLYGEMLHAGIEPDEQTHARVMKLSAR